ncbi:MAG: YvcK family protein [Eggerthellaceae bacterium]|nr:YvcK family protein [Eggerthellaceae bacterium]
MRNHRHPIHFEGSQTAAFARIKDAMPVVGSAEPPKAVVIGGGTGAPVSIRTLLSMGVETSAVVAMADDGGSTGILREEANVTPPGDIRKCLAAFAKDSQDPMTRAFKYRFEFAQNHTLGNLMLSALEYATGSFPVAIKICEEILHAQGNVHPSTLDKITLCGRTKDGRVIEGQARLCHSRTALDEVWLKQPPDVTPYPVAIKAICEADLIVLGPGSLFTSIIPSLLVPGVTDAIHSSKGKTLFVCGLADMQGETWGLSAEEHVEALMAHGMEGLLDFVLVHTTKPLDPRRTARDFVAENIEVLDTSGKSMDDVARIRSVSIDYEAARRIQKRGPRVIARNLADEVRPTWHDPKALRDAFTEVLRVCRLPQM